MAAIEVFAIPELLETVLSHLPPKDLLLSQRVHTTFRDTIKSSLILQRALLFRLPPTISPPPSYTFHQAWHLRNRLLLTDSSGEYGWPFSAECNILDGHVDILAWDSSARNGNPYLYFSAFWKTVNWSKLESILDTAVSSCLDMYVWPVASFDWINLKFLHQTNIDDHDFCVVVGFVVHGCTMREMLGLALSFRAAAKRYEEARSKFDWWDFDAELDFDWREGFMREQLSRVDGEPYFTIFEKEGNDYVSL